MNTVLHSLGCKNLGRAFVALLVTGIVLTHPASAEAAEATVPISFIVGNLWLLVAAALVFIMHHYCPVKSRIESAGWGH